MIPGIFTEMFEIKPLKQGKLNGLSFATKDSIDICNYKSGCGSPLWLKAYSKALVNAVCVDQLLCSGATCYGKTVMGELGLGLTGINSFFEATPNPRFLSYIPGGSSSGSAAAVAAGLVDFSLGTDSGGSVRVPASYCGIFGMRPSQGIISLSGINYLSPSFDTVSIFADNVDIIYKVLSVLMPTNLNTDNQDNVGNIYVLNDCFDLLDDNLRQKFYDYIKILKKSYEGDIIEINSDVIDKEANDQDKGWASVFKTILCNEIWNTLSLWIDTLKLEYKKTTFIDFYRIRDGARKNNLNEAIEQQKIQFSKINSFLFPNNLLCIPTTPNVAPKREANIKTDYLRFRKLISISSLGKLPQISVPLFGNKIPIGLSFIGAHKADFYLLRVINKLLEKKRK